MAIGLAGMQLLPELLKARDGEVKEVLLSYLRGEMQDTEGSADALELTDDRKIAVGLVVGGIEIISCIERLKDYETYISKFPFSGTRVTREAYFQFVVEGHLQELYLLRERLVSYSKAIARLYRKHVNAKDICKHTKTMEKVVVTELRSLMTLRGGHVHRERYSHNELKRSRVLGVVQTFARKAGNPLTKKGRELRRAASLQSHQQIKAQAREWNSLVSKVLETYCMTANALLIEKDGIFLQCLNANPREQSSK